MAFAELQTNTRRISELAASLRDHMTLYGYEVVSIPLIEPANTFLTRAGDKIVERLFTFDRRGRQLALRPEFTAAAANLYVQEQITDIARWQFFGPIFEDDAAKHTLDYQQYSIGAECIGLDGSAADAEIIALAVQGVDRLDLSNYQIVTGHVGLQMHILARFGLDHRTNRLLLSQRERLKDPTQSVERVFEHVLMLLALSDSDTGEEQQSYSKDTMAINTILNGLLDSTHYGKTMGGRTRNDIARRLSEKQQRTAERTRIAEALAFLAEWMTIRSPIEEAFEQIEKWTTQDQDANAIFSQWKQTIDLLTCYGINPDNIVIQADLTKNWEYYTGIVFGIETTNQDYVAGGGRYNDLTRLLGSADNVPAVGFAYYLDTLLQHLTFSETNKTQIALSYTVDLTETAIAWANQLRSHQIPVTMNDHEHAITIRIEVDSVHFNNSIYRDADINQLIMDVKAALA